MPRDIDIHRPTLPGPFYGLCAATSMGLRVAGYRVPLEKLGALARRRAEASGCRRAACGIVLPSARSEGNHCA